MKKKIAIVIPIYKSTLNQYEQVALYRCHSVLNDYPIIFVIPKSFDFDPVEIPMNNFQVIRFDDTFFKGIAGYNQLMLSSCFYKAFTKYEYILIYQLDAYIFTDNLLNWCEKGYDYVGAPWVPSQKYEQTHYRLGLRILNFFSNMTGIKTGILNYFKVGNGGFSLRKVESFLRITQLEERRINYYLSHNGPRFHEDVFWGVEMVKQHKNFKTPKWKEALDFSFDVRPHLAYKYSNHKLPMGCHAWNSKAHFDFWENHIKTRSPRHKNLVVD